MERVFLADIIDLQQWRKIQDLFSDVVGVSISTVDTKGTLLISPSKTTRLCHEVAHAALAEEQHCTHKIAFLVQHYLEKQEDIITCPCGSYHFVIPIMIEEKQVIGFLIAGPVLLGGRKRNEEYEPICSMLGVSCESFIDALHEIRVFSHKGARSVIQLLTNAINYMVKLGYQKNKLEMWLPGFMNMNEQNAGAYAHLYFNKLLTSLLDIAMNLTHAESGSIMIFDAKRNELHLKLAKGLHLSLSEGATACLHNSVSGMVVGERRGMLLTRDYDHTRLRELMKRHDITASMVVPIAIGHTVYGVCCINSFTENPHFSKGNLHIMQQLCELAAVAITSFHVDDVQEQQPFLSWT